MILAAVLSAAALLRGGDFFAAERAYTARWQANHADTAAIFALAELSLYDNRLDDAERWLSLARLRDPQDPRIAQDRQWIAMRRDPSIDRVAPHQGPAIVPFEQTDPLPMVRVEVDGRSADFLIDTGAPNLILDSAFARSLGLSAGGTAEGTFAGGRHATVAQAAVATLSLGSWTFHNLPASVLPIGNVMGNGRTAGGVLGTALLARVLATIDYRRGELILQDAGNSDAFEAQARAEGATIVPMWLAGDHFIFVRAQANDAPEGLFNVDTGATFGVQLTKPALDAAHVALDSENARAGMSGGGVTAFVPFSCSVTLGNFTKSDVHGVYAPQGDQFAGFPFEVAGAISHQFFLGSALTFDFRAMKLIVER